MIHVLADVLRIACALAAVFTTAVSLRAVSDKYYRSSGQMFRFLGLAALTLGVSVSEYHELGRSPFWPVLILNLVGVGLSLCGVLPMVRRKGSPLQAAGSTR